ncbi:MAG: class I SAM-dependent methyltransferase [Clostridia bacterium]|nr:class I SAM-dependent methyltransferase [Clostridia bacterium]MBR4467357.1 class I SAM-dependent methyltransferase [Clostridia bacterium]
MFISDRWKDYELLDAVNGERLERWGDYILIRPDPQILWKGSRSRPEWDRADAIYRRSRTGGGEWIKKDVPDEWTVRYGSLGFLLSPMGFKHTGLFPEQAVNWDWFSGLIRSAERPVKVLNLFAYTGGATVAAASAGAFVCHVDASKGMVARAKQNAALSGIPGDRIRYIVDDCAKFVQREIRRGSFYDAVILDPPSYGRGPGGERWVIEESLDDLVGLVCGVLSQSPLFVLLNSYTTGLSPSANGYVLSRHMKRFGGTVVSDELGLPVSESGIPLPAGASSRWTSSRTQL